jgi:hypothetical protein
MFATLNKSPPTTFIRTSSQINFTETHTNFRRNPNFHRGRSITCRKGSGAQTGVIYADWRHLRVDLLISGRSCSEQSETQNCGSARIYKYVQVYFVKQWRTVRLKKKFLDWSCLWWRCVLNSAVETELLNAPLKLDHWIKTETMANKNDRGVVRLGCVGTKES